MVTVLWIIYGMFLGWIILRVLPPKNDKLAREAIKKIAEEIGRNVCFYDGLGEVEFYDRFRGAKLDTEYFYKEKRELKADMNVQKLEILTKCNDLYCMIGSLAKHLGVVIEERQEPAKHYFTAIPKKKIKK